MKSYEDIALAIRGFVPVVQRIRKQWRPNFTSGSCSHNVRLFMLDR